MSLCGTGDTHCCWFADGQCPYVEAIDNPPFKWSCSLRRELGSWEAVHKDPRYIMDVHDKMMALPNGAAECGDWKPVQCADCGMGVS